MQLTIIVTMCVINIVLWIIFFVKFKNLFSTEDVIRKTRDQISLLMTEVNRNTLDNINLIDSKIEELNQAVENVKKKKIPDTKNYAEKIIEKDTAFEIKINDKPASAKKTKKVKEDVPEIYISKNPIKKNVSVKERVVELFKLGYAVDKIAKETGLSTTEVQFIIDML